MVAEPVWKPSIDTGSLQLLQHEPCGQLVIKGGIGNNFCAMVGKLKVYAIRDRRRFFLVRG
jgi:hypothetical protein